LREVLAAYRINFLGACFYYPSDFYSSYSPPSSRVFDVIL